MSEVHALVRGRVFGEQPRWHEDRLWFSDWGTQEVIAVDLHGISEVMLRGESFPLCVDWLPDGRLLVVSARDGLLLAREQDGSLVMYADLKAAAKPAGGKRARGRRSWQRLRQRRGLRPDGRRAVRARDRHPRHT